MPGNRKASHKNIILQQKIRKQYYSMNAFMQTEKTQTEIPKLKWRI